MSDAAAADVLVVVEGRAGRVTLNRPAALNSLTVDMIRLINRALDAWAGDATVELVIIDGAGERGLSAGGDIRALRESALTDGVAARAFWREEYRLNARIARYPKPIVALMDGIVMGGGIGLAGHASHRVATERLRAAMPEVGIGFFPDIGGTWLLAHAPGQLGTHLALTGDTIGAADALACGLADVHAPVDQLPVLVAALTRNDAIDIDVDAVVGDAARQLPTPFALDAARPWIEATYCAATVPEILIALDAFGTDAQAAAALIRTRSPTSLAVTLRALRESASISLEDTLDRDYRIACAFLDTPDFAEGIRAAVVDKDRRPRWSPSEHDAVTAAGTDRFFASRAEDELGLSPSRHPLSMGAALSSDSGG